MVQLPQFWSMVAKTNFAGPVQLHFERRGGDLLGAPETVFAEMKRDLAQLRSYLNQAYS